MYLYYSVAQKKRKCISCGIIVPKGTPIQSYAFKKYPGSRYPTREHMCFKCVIVAFEAVAPRVWDMYAIEKSDPESDAG